MTKRVKRFWTGFAALAAGLAVLAFAGGNTPLAAFNAITVVIAVLIIWWERQ